MVGRLVYVGRMFDKIRLHAQGKLPADYVPNLGCAIPGVFDSRACTFLGIAYEDLRRRVLAGGTDEEILAWCHEKGTPRSDFDCVLFNTFLLKRGWHDEASERLASRVKEFGLERFQIDTFFDMLNADEGRGVPKVG
jgi:gluconokinase